MALTPHAQRLLIISAVSILGVYFLVSLSKGHIDTHSVKQYASNLLSSNTQQDVYSPSNIDQENLAYMTFLSGTVANKSETDINNDPYFVATRLLGYQLLHQPETKTRAKIPFIILVTEDVPEAKRDRLAKDGATIVEVEYVETPTWVIGEMPQWKDLMTKLRAWQLHKFSRALFLDGDMVLNGCLDGIFDDAHAQFIEPMQKTPAKGYEDVPSRYLLATMAEANPVHAYPPEAANGDYKDADYFNAGFFLFGPSQDMFDYYTELLEHDNIFDPKYVEQNLLNYAHRQEARMPWQRIDTRWNIRFPSDQDKQDGVVSMHDKWWHAHMDERLQPYYSSLRWRMEGFYEARDALMKG